MRTLLVHVRDPQFYAYPTKKLSARERAAAKSSFARAVSADMYKACARSG